MSEALPRIKQISIDSDGVLITYGDPCGNVAAWIIDTDVYESNGKPYTIYHSICSKCGQAESGFPDEAGLYCRRCGSFMVNGQPGEFDKEEWLKGVAEAAETGYMEKPAEGGEDAAEGEAAEDGEDATEDGAPEE